MTTPPKQTIPNVFIIFSLAHSPSYIRPITIIINLILTGLWLAVYFSQDKLGAIIALAAIYNIHAFGIWIVFIWSLLDPRLRVYHITFLRLVIIFFITIIQFTINYTTLTFGDPSSFIPIDPNTSKAVLLGFFLFLSVTTMASHASGSGFLIPNNGGALFLLGLNGIFSLLFITFAAATIITLFIEQNKINITQLQSGKKRQNIFKM